MVFQYLDDWLLIANSEASLQDHLRTTLLLLGDLGLVVNEMKSCLTPVRKLLYIGAILDSQRLMVFLLLDSTDSSVPGASGANFFNVLCPVDTISPGAHGGSDHSGAFHPTPHAAHATLVFMDFLNGVQQSVKTAAPSNSGSEVSHLVDIPRQLASGSAVSSASASAATDHGCVPLGMGVTPSHEVCRGPMASVTTRQPTISN